MSTQTEERTGEERAGTAMPRYMRELADIRRYAEERTISNGNKSLHKLEKDIQYYEKQIADCHKAIQSHKDAIHKLHEEESKLRMSSGTRDEAAMTKVRKRFETIEVNLRKHAQGACPKCGLALRVMQNRDGMVYLACDRACTGDWSWCLEPGY
jgi:chromosome segregation ATPase